MHKCKKCGKDVPLDQQHCWGCKPFDLAFEPPEKTPLRKEGVCSNCGIENNLSTGHGLVVYNCKAPVNVNGAELCEACLAGVTKLKIVLVRGDDGLFHFDGYLPIESFREPLNAIGSNSTD